MSDHIQKVYKGVKVFYRHHLTFETTYKIRASINDSWKAISQKIVMKKKPHNIWIRRN